MGRIKWFSYLARKNDCFSYITVIILLGVHQDLTCTCDLISCKIMWRKGNLLSCQTFGTTHKHLCLLQWYSRELVYTHMLAHIPHVCGWSVSSRASAIEPRPLSLLSSNQIVFNWTHGVCSSVSPQISPHSLSFIHTGCFLHASQYHFGFSSDNSFCYCQNVCWIMRRHCLSVDNGNDLFDLSGCVHPVCRYACHRKCCQKTTTKCSKKVSRPYCVSSQ